MAMNYHKELRFSSSQAPNEDGKAFFEQTKVAKLEEEDGTRERESLWVSTLPRLATHCIPLGLPTSLCTSSTLHNVTVPPASQESAVSAHSVPLKPCLPFQRSVVSPNHWDWWYQQPFAGVCQCTGMI